MCIAGVNAYGADDVLPCMQAVTASKSPPSRGARTQPFSKSMGSASQRRVSHKLAAEKRRHVPAHRRAPSRSGDASAAKNTHLARTAPVAAPPERRLRPRPSPITTHRTANVAWGKGKSQRGNLVRAGSARTSADSEPQPAAIISRASEVVRVTVPPCFTYRGC